MQLQLPLVTQIFKNVQPHVGAAKLKKFQTQNFINIVDSGNILVFGLVLALLMTEIGKQID